MTDIIANAVVELARIAFYAFAVYSGRIVIVHWLNVGQPGLRATAQERIVDLARSAGVDLYELAQRLREGA